jgi:hypothetical protein
MMKIKWAGREGSKKCEDCAARACSHCVYADMHDKGLLAEYEAYESERDS